MVTVVILGAGFSGIAISHKLLKYTRPKVNDLKVVLVSPSTHHFWNLGAVRGVIRGEVDDDQIFHSISSGFDQYPEGSFEFIAGTATSIDVENNKVQVKTGDHSRDVEYAQLVVATGSSYPGQIPFTTTGSYSNMQKAWHNLQDEIQKAHSIIIAGGGPTGIETAAELSSHFGDSKTITVILQGDNPLPGLMQGVGKTAASELENFGAELVRNTRVVGVQRRDDGRTVVELSKGHSLEADIFLPLYGMRPNTQFVPSQFLDERGNVRLDTSLRVTGLENVWGVGDVGNLESKQLIYAERQALHLGGNLHAVLTGAEDNVRNLSWTISPQVFVTLGKNKGTGQFSLFKVPGFGITSTKGKDLYLSKAPGLIAGKNIVRSSI